MAADFWAKVQHGGVDECWPWMGGHNSNGYGRVLWNGRQQAAHRVAYVLTVGPIPPGLVLDHVKARGCQQRDCCNPDHLEAVTQAENIRRGNTGCVNAAETHCPWGHAYTPENTKVYRGRRFCRECIRRRS